MSIPSVAGCVYPVSIPPNVKKKNIDLALPYSEASPAPTLAEALPTDPKVREVLENGGFLFERLKDRSEVYLYHRLSRDGQPLKGKEATRPPRYDLVRWGSVILRCGCKAAYGSSEKCKHQRALAWWLGLTSEEVPHA